MNTSLRQMLVGFLGATALSATLVTAQQAAPTCSFKAPKNPTTICNTVSTRLTQMLILVLLRAAAKRSGCVGSKARDETWLCEWL